MISGMTFRRTTFGVTVACAALLAIGSPSHAAGTGAFAGMAGVWSGDGSVSLDNGKSERIRCRATYAVSGDGTGMNQTLVCASDSYKFKLKSNVISKGDKLSGSWSESSRNVSGQLEGHASGGKFDVVVSAPTFSADLSLVTRGDSQQVTIKSDGAFKSASISLSRT